MAYWSKIKSPSDFLRLPFVKICLKREGTPPKKRKYCLNALKSSQGWTRERQVSLKKKGNFLSNEHKNFIFMLRNG